MAKLKTWAMSGLVSCGISCGRASTGMLKRFRSKESAFEPINPKKLSCMKKRKKAIIKKSKQINRR